MRLPQHLILFFGLLFTSALLPGLSPAQPTSSANQAEQDAQKRRKLFELRKTIDGPSSEPTTERDKKAAEIMQHVVDLYSRSTPPAKAVLKEYKFQFMFKKPDGLPTASTNFFIPQEKGFEGLGTEIIDQNLGSYHTESYNSPSGPRKTTWGYKKNECTWVKEDNAAPLKKPLDEYEQLFQNNEINLQKDFMNWSAHKQDFKFAAERTLESGQEVWVISTSNDPNRDLYIDKKTYYILQIWTHRLNSQLIKEEFAGHKKVDGIVYPFVVSISTEGEHRVKRYTRIVHNPTVDQALFSIPN